MWSICTHICISMALLQTPAYTRLRFGISAVFRSLWFDYLRTHQQKLAVVVSYAMEVYVLPKCTVTTGAVWGSVDRIIANSTFGLLYCKRGMPSRRNFLYGVNVKNCVWHIWVASQYAYFAAWLSFTPLKAYVSEILVTLGGSFAAPGPVRKNWRMEAVVAPFLSIIRLKPKKQNDKQGPPKIVQSPPPSQSRSCSHRISTASQWVPENLSASYLSYPL